MPTEDKNFCKKLHQLMMDFENLDVSTDENDSSCVFDTNEFAVLKNTGDCVSLI